LFKQQNIKNYTVLKEIFVENVIKRHSILLTFDNTEVDTGYMFGLGVEYSPIENWNIEISLNKIIGDGNPGNDNFFNRLGDFSHVFIGLKYSF